MLTKDFYFDLPQELIAQYPQPQIGNDRLLVLNKKTDEIQDKMLTNLPDIIPSNALMIFNNSKVRRARVYATVESSGSTVEFLLIKPLFSPECEAQSRWHVMAKNAKRQKIGRQYICADGETKATIVYADNKSEFRTLQFDRPLDDMWFEKNGHIPLPPYIRRDDELSDASRYQTVYAEKTGSIAAPTAGLHFTQELLSQLSERGIESTHITLHVGLGTFLPVRSDHIESHMMHEEEFEISEAAAQCIERAYREKRPIVAVGTTSIRTVESAWDESTHCIRRGMQKTRIFIYPGYQFRVINTVFTNFHTPESTLLMLVSAFAGKERIMNAYHHAIAAQYRFFSYGDAMLIKES